MALLTMSNQELSRLEVIQRLQQRSLKQSEAARSLKLSIRQIQRLIRDFKQFGASGLLSKRRGKPSNNQLPANIKQYVIDIICEKYADFGPTLATEKLAELHHTFLSVETVRQLMVKAGLWKTRAERKGRVYQPRNRRACVGELIQIDGSDHDWFEGRAPRCTLLVYIDDATSQLMSLK